MPDFSENLNALEAQFRSEPGLCPGYSGQKCKQSAEYFQRLVNDPTAYCRTHAFAAAAFWDSLGFPSPPYVRLSDGAVLIVGAVPDDAATDEEAFRDTKGL